MSTTPVPAQASTGAATTPNAGATLQGAKADGTPAAPAPAPVEGAPLAKPAEGAPGPTKTEEAKDGKTAEPAKAGESPEINLTFPDGVEVDKAWLGEFLPLAKELGLKSETAQKVADLFVKDRVAQAERTQKQWAEQDRTWVEEVKADAKLGGDKLDATVRKARAAMDKIAPGLGEAYGQIGMGNHPATLRAWDAVAKAIGDDSVAGTTGATTPSKPTGDAALAQALYTSMNKE